MFFVVPFYSSCLLFILFGILLPIIDLMLFPLLLLRHRSALQLHDVVVEVEEDGYLALVVKDGLLALAEDAGRCAVIEEAMGRGGLAEENDFQAPVEETGSGMWQRRPRTGSAQRKTGGRWWRRLSSRR